MCFQHMCYQHLKVLQHHLQLMKRWLVGMTYIVLMLEGFFLQKPLPAWKLRRHAHIQHIHFYHYCNIFMYSHVNVHKTLPMFSHASCQLHVFAWIGSSLDSQSPLWLSSVIVCFWFCDMQLTLLFLHVHCTPAGWKFV